MKYFHNICHICVFSCQLINKYILSILFPDSVTLGHKMRLSAVTLPVLEAVTQGVYTLSEG